MARTHPDLNARMQRDDADGDAGRKPTHPLLWLLLLFVLLAAGIWWFGSQRGDVAPQPTVPVTDQPAVAPPAAETTPARPEPAARTPARAARTTPPATAPRASAIRDSAPMPLASNAQPKYPAAALRAGETGTVLLRVNVSAGGEPTDIAIARRSGNRDLDRAAMNAARNWRFQPAMRDGKAVADVVQIPVDFKTQ